MERPMWTCPRCGRQFHNPNGWHSCIAGSGGEDHPAGKPTGVADAYRRFEEMVLALEAYRLGTDGAGRPGSA
jgi:hypothetical protein